MKDYFVEGFECIFDFTNEECGLAFIYIIGYVLSIFLIELSLYSVIILAFIS
jgi:hypothetical protein